MNPLHFQQRPATAEKTGQQRVPRQHSTGFQRVPVENPFRCRWGIFWGMEHHCLTGETLPTVLFSTCNSF